MSGVAVIRYILANDATVTATVSSTKIMAGDLPINTALPAISIKQISGNRLKSIKHSGNELVTERIQVTAIASTYAQKDTVLGLIKDALVTVRGTVNSILVDSINEDSTGPDLYNTDPIIYEKSVDYFVRYIT